MNEAYDQLLLYEIATKFNLGLLDAVLVIDDCIKIVSAKLNLDYSIVYKQIFCEKCIPTIIHNFQTEIRTPTKTNSCFEIKEIKSCEESNNKCFFLEPFGCLERKIPDFEKINEDPDKYIKENLGDLKALKRLTEIASYLYYNFDGGGLTDNSYDALEYHLKKREKLKGRLYEKIGAPPVEKIKTLLIYPMPSVNKVKPGTLDLLRFLDKMNTGEQINLFWSLKLDGTAGEVTYKNGSIFKIETRGNGIVGGDVTYLKDFINIPKLIKIDITVRGEFVITKHDWLKKYKDTYSNARSFVNGKINSGFITPALQDIKFIAHGIQAIESSINIPKPSQGLKILDSLGFNIVYGELMTAKPTTHQLIELYKKNREDSDINIDGLYLELDLEKPKPNRIKSDNEIVYNPENAVAFKMLLEEQIRESKIINVEWNITRHGRYFPVAIYETVYIDGVRLSRATGHNAKHIADWNMGKGTKVKIVRSGDVIPQIKDVDIDASIIPIFPRDHDNGGYEWSWSGVDIVLDQIEDNREVKLKRNVFFFETLGIPMLREKTIEKLYEAGFQTPESIVKASINDMMKVKSIGKKKAEFFYKTIRDAIVTTPPDRFMIASTTYKSGLGRKTLKMLFREIPNILDMTEQSIKERLTITKLKGIGPSKISAISKSIPAFRMYLDSFAKDDIKRAITFYTNKLKELSIKGYNKMIYDKKFVLTGFMGAIDYELEDYIYDNGGDFITTVTSDVSAVICGNVLENSKKMIAASSFNIPVLNLKEFSERFNIPLKKFSEDKTEIGHGFAKNRLREY